MSHFATASTDDRAYGQPACKNLVIGDPAKALDNADSHEYFAENEPLLQELPPDGPGARFLPERQTGEVRGMEEGTDEVVGGREAC